MMKLIPHANLNWTNILFFTITPIVGIIGTLYLLNSKGVPWQTWIFSIVYIFMTGLSVTAGYHRLFAHKSYKAAKSLKLAYLFFGAGAFEGSTLEWACDHRNHHRYVDQDNDPYCIKKGFWYAHILWLFRLEAQNYDFSNVKDLQADPLIRWQQKYYIWIAIFAGFIIPMAIASLWGDTMGGLIVGGALRISVNHHATFCINSVCHYFGKATYSKRNSARDNWLASLITYGEGFHNFHHQFPLDYRNGVRFFHYDPTKWLIKMLSCLGLANDLKRARSSTIQAYRDQQKNY